jgi:hypothetical protein
MDQNAERAVTPEVPTSSERQEDPKDPGTPKEPEASKDSAEKSKRDPWRTFRFEAHRGLERLSIRRSDLENVADQSDDEES